MTDDSLIPEALGDSADAAQGCGAHEGRLRDRPHLAGPPQRWSRRSRLRLLRKRGPASTDSWVQRPRTEGAGREPLRQGRHEAIDHALTSSDLGINPSNDGQVFRLVFPELNEERRKEFVKVVRHRQKEGRVAVRNVRRATRHDLEGLEKDGDISADDLERAEKELESQTHGPHCRDRPATEPQRTGAARSLSRGGPAFAGTAVRDFPCWAQWRAHDTRSAREEGILEEEQEPQAAAEPVPERARIAGVEAGVAAGLVPSGELARPGSEVVEGASSSSGASEPAGHASLTAVSYDLPDWTDPPTLQVPRVFLDMEAAAARPGPPAPRRGDQFRASVRRTGTTPTPSSAILRAPDRR